MDEALAHIPVVTRYWLVGAFATTLAGNFGLVSPYSLLLDWGAIIYRFQVWRLVTSVLFMGGLGFPFILNMVYLYTYSTKLEQESFDGRRTDYLYLLVLGSLSLQTIGFFLGFKIIGLALVTMAIYIWSQRNWGAPIKFMFGIQFEAQYLPLALIAMTVLLGGSPILQIAGCVVGHAYYFLQDLYPAQNGGVRYLDTPAFLYDWLPQGGGMVQGQAPFPEPGRVERPGRHAWGTGRRLQ